MRHDDTSAVAVDPPVKDRLVLRRVLMWIHFAVATFTLFIFIASLNSSYILAAARAAPLVVGAPALLPYAVSARYCWQLYTWQISGPGLLRYAVFVAVLIGGAVLQNAALLGTFGPIDAMTFTMVPLWQSGAYCVAASYVLDRI